MSISYSGLTNYGKATLPSVESWGTNNNILRDPPKSIMTRRIDKVGETSEITSMIDGRTDIATEYINAFPRGRNMFVSVDYSNYGSNSGGGSSTATGFGSSLPSAQARLPYAAIQNGAFRPPVKTQDELLPLSRLRRPDTYAYTNPEVINYTRRTRMCGDDTNTREVKKNMLSVSSRPNRTYKIERPVQLEGAVIRYSTTNDRLKYGLESGIRTMDRTRQNVGLPTKEISDRIIHADATTNISAQTKGINGQNILDTDRYIVADKVYSNVTSNKSGADGTDITSLMGSVAIPNKNVLRVEGFTNKSATGDPTSYNFENKINLEKNVPQSEFYTQHVNYGNNTMENMGREVRLREKVRPGGFDGKASQPLMTRQTGQVSQALHQENINKQVLESMEQRFSSNFPN